METNKGYAYLIVSLLLTGLLGALVALKLYEVNVSPIAFITLPLLIGICLNRMIKNFKQGFDRR